LTEIVLNYSSSGTNKCFLVYLKSLINYIDYTASNDGKIIYDRVERMYKDESEWPVQCLCKTAAVMETALPCVAGHSGTLQTMCYCVGEAQTSNPDDGDGAGP
jgi:hypothetical protein